MEPASLTALISQRDDSFGNRLLAIAEDLLASAYGSVCLIDSDHGGPNQ
jgi:hypothetical protein